MEPSPPVSSPPSPYAAWVENTAGLRAEEIGEIQEHCRQMLEKPVFALFVTGEAAAEEWKLTLASIQRQIYPHWTLYVLGAMPPPTPLPAGTPRRTEPEWDTLSSDFAVFVQAGDLISPEFLYEFASELNREPSSDLIYTDEDVRERFGARHTPFFKPEWSPDYLESLPYIGNAACFRVSVAALLPFVTIYDFLLRFTEKTRRISHIEKVLYHRSSSRPLPDSQTGVEALRGRLERTGRQGEIMPHAQGAYFEIVPRLRLAPLVSIVIPTAGGIAPLRGGQVNLIENCIASIRTKSTYASYEIVVIDNGDLSRKTTAFLHDQGCRTVRYTATPFNLSQKINQGASHARGEYLILMNDDIEVITPDWIERMLAHFEKETTGIVGCKLLWENGLVQHAGVIGTAYGGLPAHADYGASPDDPGYFYSMRCVRNFMAVTGACTMTPARLFSAVGGYEEKLALCYNDTDYCLKLDAKGFLCVCDCFVKMLHFESVTRVSKAVPQEQALHFRIAWRHRLGEDAYYNQEYLNSRGPDPGSWQFSLTHLKL